MFVHTRTPIWTINLVGESNREEKVLVLVSKLHKFSAAAAAFQLAGCF